MTSSYTPRVALVRFEINNILFYFEKRSSLLQLWRCSCKFKSCKIVSWIKMSESRVGERERERVCVSEGRKEEVKEEKVAGGKTASCESLTCGRD
jgi:hypothetical protein